MTPCYGAAPPLLNQLELWPRNPSSVWTPVSAPWSPPASWSPTTVTRDQFEIAMFAPYVKGYGTNAPQTSASFDPFLSTLSGIWLCPAVNNSQAAIRPSWWWEGYDGSYNGNTWSHYSYFCRTSQWPVTGSAQQAAIPNSSVTYIYATNPTDLVDIRLLASAIIMADSTVWIGGGGWCFNHGIHGPRPIIGGGSGTGAASGVQGTIMGNQASINDCRGMNELFGDGHVVWHAMLSTTKTKLAANPADTTVPHTASGANNPANFLYFY
jgi:hypothetical protein